MGGPQKKSASENRGQLGGDLALQAEMSPAQPQPPGLQLLSFSPARGPPWTLEPAQAGVGSAFTASSPFLHEFCRAK